MTSSSSASSNAAGGAGSHGHGGGHHQHGHHGSGGGGVAAYEPLGQLTELVALLNTDLLHILQVYNRLFKE
jgi:hypothetical protein